VAQIARSVVTRMHGPYETIFRAGSIADTLFMIDRGVIAYSPNATQRTAPQTARPTPNA
jgi:hypothetical protein